ncbi:radical SAM protein [Sulfuricurvum sp.]|uniref:radical SAM protein n=1 Tax=Sulfuricurvum sp. TaxID=2025608 RepID=UPI00356958E2
MNLNASDFGTIHIEVCSKCNLACVHCYRTINEYESKNKYIEIDLFKKIIDEIDCIKSKKVLQMHGIGEPTMHPSFFELLDYANKSKKFSCIFITTNLLAAAPERYELFFENGLTFINVSVDSLSLNTINKTRKGTDPEKMLVNIERITQNFHNRIQITSVVGFDNFKELDNLAKLFIDLKIKTWVIQPLIDWESFDGSKIRNNLNVLNSIKKLKEKYKDNINILTELAGKDEQQHNKCKMPFDILHINVQGFVMPCCMYWDHNQINFGNVADKSIYAAWNSEDFSKFRSRFYEEQPNICLNCEAY